jgi:membrane protease YdiL (CAAX protease family)
VRWSEGFHDRQSTICTVSDALHRSQAVQSEGKVQILRHACRVTVAAPIESPLDRRPRLGLEVLVVLGISLGQSAVYSVLRIVERMTREIPLAQQTATLNPSATPDRPWLDLTYQLVGIGFGLMPVFLALYLLSRTNPPAGQAIGLDSRRPGFDLGVGTLIALAIGVPGLGLYLGARELGLNTQVQASGLADNWWTVPVLILSAMQNSLLEEVVMIGYLVIRFGQLGWGWVMIIAVTALVRGAYHLYQGFGGFAGNLIMGVLFGLCYLRWRRVGPLVVAHTLLDITAFVGYTLLAPRVDWL